MSEVVTPDRLRAEALVQGLVAIPSLSTQELAAATWLAGQMATLGYARAYVDAAGNAVGELGASDAPRVVMLLGHIDTVPGAIPVRVEHSAVGPLLYGRGSVDAKGPLATFVAAGARVGDAWARAHGLRVVVVGAVEEEAATSKGARAIRARFDGVAEPVPTVCVIGEPSGAHRITLGYKGRLLVELTAMQPMAHSAGPDAGIATYAVDLWNHVVALAARTNAPDARAFDQLIPSLRRINTETTADMVDRVSIQIGMRLPPNYDVREPAGALVGWANRCFGGSHELPAQLPEAETLTLAYAVGGVTAELVLRGYEQTWRSSRDPLLVGSFLAALRAVAPEAKPSFVVKTGTSDMNVVAPVWGCPIVAYGPGDSSLDHTPHEHLNLDEYWQAILVLEAALRELGRRLAATA